MHVRGAGVILVLARTDQMHGCVVEGCCSWWRSRAPTPRSSSIIPKVDRHRPRDRDDRLSRHAIVEMFYDDFTPETHLVGERSVKKGFYFTTRVLQRRLQTAARAWS